MPTVGAPYDPLRGWTYDFLRLDFEKFKRHSNQNFSRSVDRCPVCQGYRICDITFNLVTVNFNALVRFGNRARLGGRGLRL